MVLRIGCWYQGSSPHLVSTPYNLHYTWRIILWRIFSTNNDLEKCKGIMTLDPGYDAGPPTIAAIVSHFVESHYLPSHYLTNFSASVLS